MKKLLAFILAALIFAGAGTGIAFAIIGNRPQNIVRSAIADALEDVVERDDIKPVYNMFKRGSLSVSVDKMTKGDVDLLEGANFSGKMYFSKDAFMMENLKINYGELKIDADMYYSSDLIYMSEEELFDAAYGVRLDELAEDLKDSIFAYGSGSDYAIPDEETWNEVIESLEKLEELDSKELKKDAEKLAKKLFKKAWKIACDNFEFESEKDEVRINGKKEKVRVISIVIDGKAAANFVSDFYDFIAKDDSIEEFLEKYEDQITVSEGDKSIVEMYEDKLAELEDTIDDVCDNIENSIPEDIIINVMTPRNSKTLAKLEVNVEKTSILSIDIGKDGMKKTDKISLSFAGEKVLTYEIKENNNKELVAELEVGGNTLKIDIDKRDDEFTLTIKRDGDLPNIKVTGDFISKFGKTTITVDKIISGEETIKCDIELVIDEKDKMPAPPKNYDRISDIKDEDVQEWIEKLDEINIGGEWE